MSKPDKLYHMCTKEAAQNIKDGGLGLRSSNTYGATRAGLAANRACSPENTVILCFRTRGFEDYLKKSSENAWYIEKNHIIPVSQITVLNRKTSKYNQLREADLDERKYFNINM